MIHPGILRGLKTNARFDVRSIEHILSGLSMGHLAKKTNHTMITKKLGVDKTQITTRYFDIIFVLFVAFMREAIEHYLETGLAGNNVKYRFQGVEFWGNRLITDPLMMILGYLIIKKYPQLLRPARLLSLIWLLAHIFIFPNSMYLQHLF